MSREIGFSIVVSNSITTWFHKIEQKPRNTFSPVGCVKDDRWRDCCESLQPNHGKTSLEPGKYKIDLGPTEEAYEAARSLKIRK